MCILDMVNGGSSAPRYRHLYVLGFFPFKAGKFHVYYTHALSINQTWLSNFMHSVNDYLNLSLQADRPPNMKKIICLFFNGAWKIWRYLSVNFFHKYCNKSQINIFHAGEYSMKNVNILFKLLFSMEGGDGGSCFFQQEMSFLSHFLDGHLIFFRVLWIININIVFHIV